MISFCSELENCTYCGALTRNYYKRSAVVLCIDCLNLLGDTYYQIKREKFLKSDYDSFKEFLENE